MSKKEGTTQTYGQLINIVSAGDVYVSSSPGDIVVKLIVSSNSPISLTDNDKLKILVAAFSEIANPMVSLNVDSASVLNTANAANASTVQPTRTESAIVVGTTLKNKANLKLILNEAKKCDMLICLNSQYSEDLEFVNLKEVELSSKFTYNFFAFSSSWIEDDIGVQEDPSKDPLLYNKLSNVPMYVQLNWNTVGVTEDIGAQEESNLPADTMKDIEAFKKLIFEDKRGISNLYSSTNIKKSYEKYNKNRNPMIVNGVPVEIVDIDHLDQAINSTSNKNVFANTINMVIDASNNRDRIEVVSTGGSVTAPKGSGPQPISDGTTTGGSLQSGGTGGSIAAPKTSSPQPISSNNSEPILFAGTARLRPGGR